jgi:hypothetical protein
MRKPQVANGAKGNVEDYIDDGVLHVVSIEFQGPGT